MEYRNRLMLMLEDYANQSRTLEFDSGTDILSALVNLVDTARENPLMFRKGTQSDREAEITEFILIHRT